jgi:SdrD B-like domain/PKD domain
MRSWRFLRLTLAAALAGAAGLVSAGVATAAPAGAQTVCYAGDTDAAIDANTTCRNFVVGVVSKQRMSRAEVLAHAGDYRHFGFTDNFLWYSAEGTTTISDPALEWTGCGGAYQVTPIGQFCARSRVDAGSLLGNFSQAPVTLSSFSYGGAAIFRACGNWAPAGPVLRPGSARLPSPVPVIRGKKFNDLNHNGVQDSGEPGIAGWTFTLTRISSLFGDQAPGPVATTTTGSGGSYSFSLNGFGPGTYTVTEASKDRWVATGPTTRTVTVGDGIGGATITVPSFGNYYINHPPVADAGPDQYVDQTMPASAQVTLDGSGSSDPDNDPLTYTWTGPFGTATGPHPTVTLPAGTSTVTLTVNDGLASDTDRMAVAVYPPITAAAGSVHGVEGAPVSGTVATFTDPDPTATAGEYAAVIDWGDGTPGNPDTSTGTVSGPTGGPFTVTSTHTYADEGSYPVKVTITDTDNAFNTATVIAPASVDDAVLAASGNPGLLSANPLTDTTLATFTDANPGGSASDFTAVIDWGDGAPTSTGTISGPNGGPFTVTGSHTYDQLGPYTITITITDDGGATTTATAHVIVYAPSGFAIGDTNTAVGAHVQFWGAQWARENTLTGGPGADAFKGYITSRHTPACDATWTTDPGNSGHPPATVPTYIAVTVTSHVTQNGDTITGDTTHVVVVKTGPGYAGNPGHPGTGTIVATLC